MPAACGSRCSTSRTKRRRRRLAPKRERLGLGAVLEEAGFATGTIVVLDGRSKEILAWINGSRDFTEYRAAIDAALAAAEL